MMVMLILQCYTAMLCCARSRYKRETKTQKLRERERTTKESTRTHTHTRPRTHRPVGFHPQKSKSHTARAPCTTGPATSSSPPVGQEAGGRGVEHLSLHPQVYGRRCAEHRGQLPCSLLRVDDAWRSGYALSVRAGVAAIH